MKKLLIAFGVAAAMMSGSAMAADLSFDAPLETTVQFGGEIVQSTCQYDAPVGRGLSKNLGKHVQNDFNTDKEGKTEPVEFGFEFKKCPVVGTKKKTALQMWVENKNNLVADAEKGLLSNMADGTDNAATNVFVQILKEDESVLKLGKNLETVEKALPTTGMADIDFKFKARLYSEGKNATPGIVSATAPFMVEYK